MKRYPYNTAGGIPVPTKISDLINDRGYLTKDYNGFLRSDGTAFQRSIT